jgi:hypothetical protein
MNKQPPGGPLSKDDEKYPDDQFYETLQQSMGEYTSIEDTDRFDTTDETDDLAENDATLTAIITIVLTILVALIMGVLFLRGIDAVNSSASPQTNSSTQAY